MKSNGTKSLRPVCTGESVTYVLYKFREQRSSPLLAHLSRQAHMGELTVYPCSGVRRRRQQFANISSFEIA